MLVGDALAIGEVRGVLAFVLIAIGFARKAKKEESYLASEFGPAFDEHVRRTGFFLPRFS
jgi:protein-S-isoprenylcysteine O-methyltransferase Ste14